MATTYWCPASCLPRRVSSWPSSMRSTGRHSVSSPPSCCSAGLALHLVGHVWFKARVFHSVNRIRVAPTIVLVVAIPVVQHLEAIPALAVPMTILAVVVVLETRHHTALGRQLSGPS